MGIKKVDSTYARATLWLSSEWIKKELKTLFENNLDNKLNNEVDYLEPKELPPLIELNKEQCFRDENDEIINIKMVGYERSENSVYFCLEDVIKGFQIDNLNRTIHNETSNYKLGIDYLYFSDICEDKLVSQKVLNYDFLATKNVRTRIKIKELLGTKKIYLTYKGLLTVLFASHSQKTKKFP